MAYFEDDVQPSYAGGLAPGRRHLLTLSDFEVFDYNESILTLRKQFPIIRITSNHRFTESPSTIQLARERLRRSFDETIGVNRVDSIITLRRRLQAWTGGSEVDDIVTHYL